MKDAMTIAYLTSVYPRATDTFVRNEVLRLREQGHTIHTFSIRRADDSQMVSALVRSESANTYSGTDSCPHLPREFSNPQREFSCVQVLRKSSQVRLELRAELRPVTNRWVEVKVIDTIVFCQLVSFVK